MDLVDLQQNTKRIRNPFGFDFRWTWNKRPIVLKGDGEWKTVIARLRDHLAWHLYNKVRNQYHDEQVAKLRLNGRERDAKKFRVSSVVEDKIYMMITGEKLHKEITDDQVQQEAADLTELNKEISKLETTATGEAVSVSGVIENAMNEALNDTHLQDNAASAHRGHSAGTAQINDEKAPVDPIEAAAGKGKKADAKPESPEGGDGSAFDDLKELEN